MKAKLYFLKDNWFAIIPPARTVQLDLFSEQTEQEIELERHSVDIYELNQIDTEEWRNGKEINGEIIRIKNKIYFQIDSKEISLKKSSFENSKTFVLLNGLLGNFSNVAITLQQFEYLQNIAKSENYISSYFSNGFCINYKYVIFGKLTRDNNIIYPQIKIKQK